MTAPGAPAEPAASQEMFGTWDAVLETADRVFGGRMFDVGELLRLTARPPAKLSVAIRQLAKRGFIESYGYMVQITAEGHTVAEGFRRHLNQLKKATDELYSALHGGTSCVIVGRHYNDRIGVLRLAATEANPMVRLTIHDASTMTAQLSRPRLPSALAFTHVSALDRLQEIRMRNAGGTAFFLEGPRPQLMELHGRLLSAWRLIDLDGIIEPAMYRKSQGF